MKFVEYKTSKKDGTEVAVQVAYPETLAELVKIYGEDRPLYLGRKEMIDKAVKRAVSQRSRRLNLRLNDLSLEQKEALRKLGLLKHYV